MAITNWMEKLGRTLFEAPWGSAVSPGDVPELAEIRLAILDEVKAHSHRVAGRDVFPHNRVRIFLRGVPDQQAAPFRGKFFGAFCEAELRKGLRRANYRFPDDLKVEVETSPELPAADQQWLSVEAESIAPQNGPAQPKRAARLTVVKGTANHPEIVLNKARINIGRTVDVYRSNGPSRRNDLAFDEMNEISRTVSREHAHIAWLRKSGEYRLYNDRAGAPDSNCGLWVIRDGLSYEVHRGPRGVRLESGDEIHLGRAVVKFVQRA